jgi:hypothetical protein
MSGLRELQTDFLRAVLEGNETATAESLRAGPISAAARLAVYRTTVRENFFAALAAGFPVILARLGETEFRQMAFAYQRQHPSRAGSLQWVGESLATFLKSALGDTPEEYLVSLARLEWAVQEASTAADSAHLLDLPALAAVSEFAQELLHFEFHPAVRLLQLPHPVYHLWQAHRDTDSVPSSPGSVPESLLIRRLGEGVELWRLAGDDYEFLAALAAGSALTAALAVPLAMNPAFDPGAILVRCARSGVITGFSTLSGAGTAT